MEILLGALLGIVVAGIGAFILMRNGGRTAGPVEPAIDTSVLQTEVSRTVSDALTQALSDLTERARLDRDESLRLATELITKASADQLGTKTELINSTVNTVKDQVGLQLNRINEALVSLQTKSATQHESMENVVKALTQRTASLHDILSNSQARGQWGERLAEDMLRAAGFMEGINYHKQTVIDGGGRPDYHFDMPPNRVLFMDVKFPLDKYVEYVNATSDTERNETKRSFLAAVTGHVATLAKRDYIDKSTQNTIDYVLMFVPNEGISGFVHEVSPELIDKALEQKVILCSPLTLYAFLVVIRQAAESFHTEQTAADVMRLINLFNKQWEEYTKTVENVAKSFDKMQSELESISTGGTRYRKLKTSIGNIEKLRKQQGIPELPVGDAELESDEVFED